MMVSMKVASPRRGGPAGWGKGSVKAHDDTRPKFHRGDISVEDDHPSIQARGRDDCVPDDERALEILHGASAATLRHHQPKQEQERQRQDDVTAGDGAGLHGRKREDR